MSKPSKKPQKKVKTRVRKTYDTIDRTNPSKPVEKKAIVYSDSEMTHIIFVTPDKLNKTLHELMSDIDAEDIDAKIDELVG